MTVKLKHFDYGSLSDGKLPTINMVKKLFNLDTTEFYKVLGMFGNKADQIFELWTKEYIDDLSNHIKESVKKYNVPNRRGSILEVGAGNGELSFHLEKHGLPIVATDDLSWEIEPRFPVTVLDFGKALEIYEPTIVICSWMPLGADWTLYFRSQKSVQEYIIIGESEHGCVGSPTIWGDHKGFDWVDLDFYQLCRTDFKFGENISLHSSTFSFKRKGD